MAPELIPALFLAGVVLFFHAYFKGWIFPSKPMTPEEKKVWYAKQEKQRQQDNRWTIYKIMMYHWKYTNKKKGKEPTSHDAYQAFLKYGSSSAYEEHVKSQREIRASFKINPELEAKLDKITNGNKQQQ